MGFYSTKSPETGAYVADKRDTNTGLKIYDEASGNIGLQKQQALQNLRQNYASTINNAYASYLASQRNINTSLMGQGYKQAYLKAQDQALQQQIYETNLSAAQNASDINTQMAEAQTALQEAYNTEVTNLDRVATSMNDYYTYIKSLRGTNDKGEYDDSIKYFNNYQEELNAEDMYKQLINAQPKNLTDGTTQGMDYLTWINNEYKDSQVTADKEWLDWLLYSGGYSDFKTAIEKRGVTENYTKYETNLKALDDVLSNLADIGVDTSGLSSTNKDDILKATEKQFSAGFGYIVKAEDYMRTDEDMKALGTDFSTIRDNNKAIKNILESSKFNILDSTTITQLSNLVKANNELISKYKKLIDDEIQREEDNLPNIGKNIATTIGRTIDLGKR